MHAKTKFFANGSYVQDDDNAKKVRDGLTHIASRKPVLNPVSMIFSCTYDSILIWSSKCSCIECKGDSIEWSKNGRAVGLELRYDQVHGHWKGLGRDLMHP